MHVLLAADDFELGQALQLGLAAAGISVDWKRDGLAADSEFQVRDYDALVLDLRLTERGGLDWLQRLRQSDPLVPIVVVSSCVEVGARIQTLDLGADDCLTKPFALVELVARLKAVSRRVAGDPAHIVKFEDVQIDLLHRSVTLAGVTVALSPQEFSVLRLLAQSQGTVSKAQINDQVTSCQPAGTHKNVAVVCVRSLRKKLGRDLIATYRGSGYRIRTGQP